MKRTVAVFAAASLVVVLTATVQLGRASMVDDTVGAKPITKKFLLYVVRPITNKRILPNTEAIPGKISDTLPMVAAPGEYEPASFVIRAKEDIEGLKLEVTDLKADDGHTIRSSNIDIKVVKVWYQDEGRGLQEQPPAQTYNPIVLTYRNKPSKYKKVLVPELLLNDDSLIKVDTEEKHNYVRVSEAGKPKHLLISGDKEGEGMAGSPAIPVTDSPSLLPVDIRQNTNKQFWVTVKVPASAPAGIYTARVEFKTEGESLGALKLQLRVLPFKLAEAYDISSMYYYGPSSKVYGDRVTEQFGKEMKNMYAHGVANPILPGPLGKLEEYLKIRKAAGMNGKAIFYTGVHTGNPTAADKLQSLRDKVKKVVEIAGSQGVEEVYIYGIDEALCLRKRLGHKTPKDPIKRFTSQRPAWEAVHEAGGNVFVAGVRAGHYRDERSPGNIGLMGDIQDLMVCHGYPHGEEAAKWHAKGHKIACYGNPQSGVEQPDTYRRNYGLLLWQNDYDGGMTYIYHWNWGDFCRPTYKQHNMVYPTMDGVIDTIQWEGYREGVDDVKYLNTLLEAIEKAEGSQKKNPTLLEAKQYVKQLKDNDINETKGDLGAIRSKVIDYILARYTDLEGPGTIRPGRRLQWWIRSMSPDVRRRASRPASDEFKKWAAGGPIEWRMLGAHRLALLVAIGRLGNLAQQPQQFLANLRLGVHLQATRRGRPGRIAAQLVLLRRRQITPEPVGHVDIEARAQRAGLADGQARRGIQFARDGRDSQLAKALLTNSTRTEVVRGG